MKLRPAALLALLATLTGCSAQGVPLPASIAAPTATSTAAFAPGIDWSEARAHLGSTAIVCGPVVSTFTAESSNGRPTFLNLGVDYPDPAGLTVIIFDDYRGAFPFDPAIEYQNDSLCVTGTIREHGDFVQIEARSPDQIAVQG